MYAAVFQLLSQAIMYLVLTKHFKNTLLQKLSVVMFFLDWDNRYFRGPIHHSACETQRIQQKLEKRVS